MDLSTLLSLLIAAFSLIVGILTGSLTSAIFTAVVEGRRHRRDAQRRRIAILASVVGELRHAKAILEHNEKLGEEEYAAIVRLPVSNIGNAINNEGHLFEGGPDLLTQWQVWLIGAEHVNQLVNIHNGIWFGTATKDATGQSTLPQRRELRSTIVRLCGGWEHLGAVGVVDTLVLPSFLEYLTAITEETLTATDSKRRLWTPLDSINRTR